MLITYFFQFLSPLGSQFDYQWFRHSTHLHWLQHLIARIVTELIC